MINSLLYNDLANRMCLCYKKLKNSKLSSILGVYTDTHFLLSLVIG